MYELNKIENLYPFNVKIILDFYIDLNRIYGYVTIEHLLDVYEDEIQTRLLDLHYGLCADDAVLLGGHPWKDLSILSDEIVENLNELTGMKTQMTKEELIDIMNFFNMTYFYEGILHIPPIREVW